MTDQQAAAIQAVLSAAPTLALRRVVRQPERLWTTGTYVCEKGKRCLSGVLDDWKLVPSVGGKRRSRDGIRGSAQAGLAFDAACAADGLPATVRTCKRLTREEIARR